MTEIDLAVPGLTTIARREDDDLGVQRFREVLRRWFPRLDEPRIDLLASGITEFRARLAAGGWIYHGIAGAPAGTEFSTTTSWQYLAATFALPSDPMAPELLLARTLGWSRLPAAPLLKLDTAMGWGVGFRADVRYSSMLTPAARDNAPDPDVLGLAAYVSVDEARGQALLVVGLSLLPGTTEAMATLAELMASRSSPARRLGRQRVLRCQVNVPGALTSGVLSVGWNLISHRSS